MQSFKLNRFEETSLSTWGDFYAPDQATPICQILERGAQNPAHPRIPAGIYEIGRKPLGASHFDGEFKTLIGADYKGILLLPNVPGRSNIEIHTANIVQQLEGCLATGGKITKDDHGDFAIEGGTSKPAYAHIYPLISAAIDNGGAQIEITDIAP